MDNSFEYLKKLSPFEVFLKYTDEKKITAERLNIILSELASETKSYQLLDIGSGNAELIARACHSITSKLELTLLEPSGDLASEIGKSIQQYSPGVKYSVVNSGFEDFTSSNKYNFILASHLYHIKRGDIEAFLSKALSLLKEGGVMIFIWRCQDDVSTFKELFKVKLNPELYPKGWKAKTIEEVISVLDGMKDKPKFELRVKSTALVFPVNKSLEDVHSIIEFFLNTQWTSIPKKLQVQVLEYIISLQGKFTQKEGYLIIKK